MDRPMFGLLLAAGADFHLRDKRGRTPYYLAAESGDLESVKVLIDAGADVNAAASDGLNAASMRPNKRIATRRRIRMLWTT